MMPSDICYTHTRGPIFVTRGFTQHLTETDTETRRHTLGGAEEILWKKGGRIVGTQRDEGHHKKTESTNLGS